MVTLRCGIDSRSSAASSVPTTPPPPITTKFALWSLSCIDRISARRSSRLPVAWKGDAYSRPGTSTTYSNSMISGIPGLFLLEIGVYVSCVNSTFVQIPLKILTVWGMKSSNRAHTCSTRSGLTGNRTDPILFSKKPFASSRTTSHISRFNSPSR